MKSRRNTLTIELRTSRPISKRQAAYALRLLLAERLDLQQRPIWASDPAIYAEKLIVKER